MICLPAPMQRESRKTMIAAITARTITRLTHLRFFLGALNSGSFFGSWLGAAVVSDFHLGCFHGRFSFSLLSPAGRGLLGCHAPL